jgi:uncharacterized protein
MKTRIVVVTVVLLLLPTLDAQVPTVQINRENRTIAVTADDSVEVPAEIAVLDLGYHSFAATKDAAYDDSVRTANRILKSLAAAGVTKDNIETEKLSLSREEPEENRTAKPKPPRFEARQNWKVRVRVSQAQQVVDLAVRAGANEVNATEWAVADPVGLQAKASAAALAKARQVAEQMAKGLGAKLGQLVYASNRAPVVPFWGLGNLGAVETAVATLSKAVTEPQLTLYPQKVKSQATVYAVFAIE